MRVSYYGVYHDLKEFPSLLIHWLDECLAVGTTSEIGGWFSPHQKENHPVGHFQVLGSSPPPSAESITSR